MILRTAATGTRRRNIIASGCSIFPSTSLRVGYESRVYGSRPLSINRRTESLRTSKPTNAGATTPERLRVHCNELIGWHKGGLERGYPDYVPEPKLGGVEGFRELMQSVHHRNTRCWRSSITTFWIPPPRSIAKTSIAIPIRTNSAIRLTGWRGERARSLRKGFSVRRHMAASIVPPLQDLLDNHFVQIAKDEPLMGCKLTRPARQTGLDFNPMNTRKPDEGLNQGLVDGIARVYRKCKAVNPDFCIASEASYDRMIPYVDVFYRAASGSSLSISPLRGCVSGVDGIVPMSLPLRRL